jgi:hypothetical protein
LQYTFGVCFGNPHAGGRRVPAAGKLIRRSPANCLNIIRLMLNLSGCRALGVKEAFLDAKENGHQIE